MRADRLAMDWALRLAAAGVLLGASLAASELVAQRFFELGFSHSAAREVAARSLCHAIVGAAVGLLGSLLASLVSKNWSFPWSDGMARSKLALAGAAAAAVAAGVARQSGWLGPIDATALGLACLTFAFAVAIVPFLFLGTAESGRRDARTLALLVVVALLLAGGYLQNRPWLGEIGAPANLVGNALLLVTASCSFWLFGTASSWPSVSLLSAAALFWLVSPLLLPPTIPVTNPKSVLLIAVDTLRFDHTSLAGAEAAEPFDRPRTPNLLRLRDRGVSFDQAISQAPWTMPAFAAIVTGLYPNEHGAISLNDRISPGVVTLAELLREGGYRTAGIVSHVFVDSHHGFAQGFDSYDEDFVLGHLGKSSEGISERAIGFLTDRASDPSQDEPFFLFLHFFDPHFEYEDHADLNFADEYSGWLRGAESGIEELRKRREQLDPSDLRFLRDLYDEEIASTDRAIGRIFDALEALHSRDRVAVVFVADHGEEFMEHGWLGHTSSMYEEVLRVPLLFALPGELALPDVAVPVETRAVFPTLLDYLGLRSAAGSSQGSLLPLIRGGAGEAHASVRSIVSLDDLSPNNDQHIRAYALREGPWKYLWNATRGRSELFDLASDPSELRDLSQIESERSERMRAQLDEWIRQSGESTGGGALELDEAERERLRALGYL